MVVPSAPDRVSIEPLEAKPKGGARQPQFRVRVELADAARLGQVYANDLSKGGMFVATSDQVPAQFTPLELVIALSSGGPEVALNAEVVRAVAAADAANWGLQPGMALQLTNLDAAGRKQLEAMAKGTPQPQVPTPPGRASANEAAVEKLISRLEGAMRGTPYDALSVPPSADDSTIRDTLRRLLRDTEPAGIGQLSDGLTARLQSVQEKLKAATEVLLDPLKRAEYDASKGNYLGVAAALRAGLGIEALAKLRRTYLGSHVGAEAGAHPHMTQAVIAEREGRFDHALSALERALKCDPLNVQIHQRYWAVMHQKKQKK